MTGGRLSMTINSVSYLHVEMCVDMRIDMCIDMYIGMYIGMCIGTHVCGQEYRHEYIDI